MKYYSGLLATTTEIEISKKQILLWKKRNTTLDYSRQQLKLKSQKKKLLWKKRNTTLDYSRQQLKLKSQLKGLHLKKLHSNGN